MAETKSWTVICPCCEAAIFVDAQTGIIISHEEKAKPLASFEEMAREMENRKKLREQVFSQELGSVKDRERLLEILDEMRTARQSNTVHRDHVQPSRCRACGYRAACDEALE